MFVHVHCLFVLLLLSTLVVLVLASHALCFIPRRLIILRLTSSCHGALLRVLYVCVYIYISISLSLYIYIYMYMYIYIYDPPCDTSYRAWVWLLSCYRLRQPEPNDFPICRHRQTYSRGTSKHSSEDGVKALVPSPASNLKLPRHLRLPTRIYIYIYIYVFAAFQTALFHAAASPAGQLARVPSNNILRRCAAG